MLYYHKPVLDGNLTLSIDNIILDASIIRPELRDLLSSMLLNISSGNSAQVVSWESRTQGTFRYQTSIQIDANKSFWLGNGLISGGTLTDRYRLDANPNKVGDNPNFKIVRDFLVRNSRGNLCKIARFDLAIDIPVDRSQCFLVKDRRLYIERRHGVEYTQYLGAKSSHVGRAKLYNKAVEAKIGTPLTRLELTLAADTPYEDLKLPEVYRLDSAAMAMDDVKLSKTDRFILNAVLHDCGKVTDLGRKTRDKITGVMDKHLRKIKISKEAYSQILDQLTTYCTNGATTT